MDEEVENRQVEEHQHRQKPALQKNQEVQ
jgi:hypothetical protein